MFAKLFEKVFITTKNIPSEIICNYRISDDLCDITDIHTLISSLYDKTNKKHITFYTIQNQMFNPIMQQYCYYMGFDYDIYKCIIEYNDFYTKVIVKPYEPYFKDDDIRLIDKRRFYVVSQSIPWNYGVLPNEYWINHYITDEYANGLYKHLMKSNDESLIKDPMFNMGFNTEFDCLLFNWKLMKLLQSKKFILRGVKSHITEEEIINESKFTDLNFDNKSIYLRDNIKPSIQSIEIDSILDNKETDKNDN